MPSTDRKLELKAKTSVAQTGSQPYVYAKGLKSTAITCYSDMHMRTALVIRADLSVASKEAVQGVNANTSSISSRVMARGQDNIINM
jgi:hypothetical protein